MIRRTVAKRLITGDQGFSLIELLVAVAILSFAAVTLLESQTQAVGISSAVEQRALAAIVAENRLVLALGLKEEPIPGTRTGSETQMGVVFNWRETVRSAPGGDLTTIHIVVSTAESRADLASLTGFRKGD
tara:strand:- start:1615 stop:2007 length:393 start_codon:yes stop_codon:yes gene_type:complete